MKLYHVSLLTKDEFTRKFVPRIPEKEKRMSDEEGTIPRICFSDKINNAIDAIPMDWEDLEAEIYDGHDVFVTVFEMDTQKYRIKPENILTHEDLLENKYVRDANYTHEHWIINQEIEVREEDLKTYRITNLDLDIKDLYSWDVIDIVMSEKNPWEDFEDVLAYLEDEELIDIQEVETALGINHDTLEMVLID